MHFIPKAKSIVNVKVFKCPGKAKTTSMQMCSESPLVTTQDDQAIFLSSAQVLNMKKKIYSFLYQTKSFSFFWAFKNYVDKSD